MATSEVHSRLADEFANAELGELEVPGVGLRPALAPSSVNGMQRALAISRDAGWSLRLAGHGTRLGLGPAPARVDLVLSTRNLDGVTAFEPGDGTLTAQAGCNMAELARITGAAGFELSPDVANPGRHSLGGILAAGVSGIDRARRGPARHHVLGMGVLLADGRLAKTGGRLVKNVTGYDLQRLYSGSRGSLCLIVEASLRLFPMPSVRACVQLPHGPLDEIFGQAQRVARLGVQAFSILSAAAADSSSWQTELHLAGRAESVASEVERISAQWPAAGLLGEQASARRYQARRDALEGACGQPFLRIACLPTRLAPLLKSILPKLNDIGDPRSLTLHPSLASAQLSLHADCSASDLAAVLELAQARGAMLELQNLEAPPSSPAEVHNPAARALSRRLKQALDPGHLFVGGLDYD